MMNHRKIDENDLEKPKLMNRAFNIIKSLLNGVIISGINIFMIGLYYLIIKAGSPYQAADRNSYSWNLDFIVYGDGSGYEARFTKCGICTLMKELGIYEFVPAMCHLDYTMNDMGGTSTFVRKYTLASGGQYCDCGYKKK